MSFRANIRLKAHLLYLKLIQKQTKPITRSRRIDRFFDRYLGVIILKVLSRFKKIHNVPKKPSKVAVSILGAIGDAIVATSVIRDLRDALPDATISLLLSETNKGVFELIPGVDSIVLLPVKRPDRAIQSIRREKFDLFVDCNQWLRISAIHAAFAGCFTIGFRTAGQYRHYGFDAAVDHLATRHEIDNYRQLLEPLGIKAQSMPGVVIPNKAITAYKEIFSTHGIKLLNNFVVFHPWAGGTNASKKEWPNNNWVALASRLQQLGFQIIVTGSKGDIGRADQLVYDALEKSTRLVSVAGMLTLTQTAALLQAADAVVCVNTGIMHLAAAIQARVIALHGPTNPSRWGPIGDTATSLIPTTGVFGYLHLGFEFPNNAPDCMSAISYNSVEQALMLQLRDRRQCFESSEGDNVLAF